MSMKRLCAILLAALALIAAPARAAPVFALFVGLENYGYQKPPHDDADLARLSGARADIARMRQVLTSGYGLRPETTIELIDAQATRLAIAEALDRQIVAAAQVPGATVLFYFSGHGGQITDSTRTQFSGKNSTIIPFDGRSPGVLGDILDVELKPIIDQANAWGVTVVTIFDSCNSGTATRGMRPMHTRSAKPASPTDVAPSGGLPLPRLPGGVRPATAGAGLRVHLAAAQDGEAAGESEVDGQYRGDFTAALAGALQDQPGATYADIAAAVRTKLSDLGLQQHPHAEGALTTRFLGADRDQLRLYPATAARGGGYTVTGGALAGITVGSTFDAFASAGQARATPQQPIGHGRIVRAGASQATLRFDPPLAKAPASLVLIETAHDFGERKLAVGVDAPAGPARDRLTAQLATLPFVSLAAENAQVVVQPTADGPRLVDATGLPLTAPIADAEFHDVLGAVAKYKALLALPTADASAKVSVEVRRNCKPDAPCLSPPWVLDGEVLLGDGQPFILWVRNETADRPYFIYAYRLGRDFSVSRIAPVDANDAPETLAPGSGWKQVQALRTAFDEPPAGLTAAERGLWARNDRDYYLVIASSTELPAEALVQKGVSQSRGALSPLAQLLSQAGAGQRSGVAAPLGAWGARLISVRTVPAYRP